MGVLLHGLRDMLDAFERDTHDMQPFCVVCEEQSTQRFECMEPAHQIKMRLYQETT